MLQEQKLTRFFLPGTVFLCLLVGASLIAWRLLSKPAPATIVKRRVETSPDEALKYWTADKMRNTTATNMPRTDAIKPGKKHRHHSSRKSHQQHS
ncbi:MAG: hypothetical protein JO215_08370 [Ktedonobacteraceae bacterium]|nr:hypothetical protein [Ktedonobacteraceae bacterium]MBV9710702.1 hypothetical protein [Ktedonobacteraceae bacterium]